MSKIALVTNSQAFAGPAAIAGLAEQGMTIVELERDTGRSPEEAIDEVVKKYGRIDVLVNNDVLLEGEETSSHRDPVLKGTIDQVSPDNFRRMLEDVLVYPFTVTKHVVPTMIQHRSGVILFITSCNAVRVFPNVSLYNAARAGATNMAASLAKELGPHGITVNAIGPTFFSNPTYFPDDKPVDLELQALIDKDVPIRRLGTKEEMASLIGFLASGKVPPITGEFIAFSGGWRV